MVGKNLKNVSIFVIDVKRVRDGEHFLKFIDEWERNRRPPKRLILWCGFCTAHQVIINFIIKLKIRIDQQSS